MASSSQFEQFDRIVDAILSHTEVRSADGDGGVEMAELVRVARELLGLPREEFKNQLKNDLQRRAKMASAAVKPIRKGFHTITQYLIIPDSLRMLEFLKNVFGATDIFKVQRPGTTAVMHAEARIGDSMIELADSSEQFPPAPAALHVFVDDVDAVYARALANGAKAILAPVDQEYGERGGSIVDEFGNRWYIATPLKGQSIPEGLRAVTPYLALEKSVAFIAFLKKAFGAEEKLLVQSPDGVVHHAKIAIGDSILEMSDARGAYGSLPCAIHLYVPDTDAVYEQALRAGARSLMPPADQPYGDRSGGVIDPFGNQWFIATHIKDVAF